MIGEIIVGKVYPIHIDQESKLPLCIPSEMGE